MKSRLNGDFYGVAINRAYLAYDVVLSPRVFSRTRWDEARQIRLPLYRAIVADGIPLTAERIPA